LIAVVVCMQKAVSSW